MVKLKELNISCLLSSIYTKLINQLFPLVESLIRHLSGRLGWKLRAIYYSRRARSCGKNLVIDEGVIIRGIKDIHFGDNVWVDKYCVLMAGRVEIDKKNCIFKQQQLNVEEGIIQIGNNIHIGIGTIIQGHGGVKIGDFFTSSAGAKIYSLSNNYSLSCNGTVGNNQNMFFIKSKIVIADNVWIGLNSIILGGLINKDSFIAPNSIVMTDVKENSFMLGNPAKKIKDRFKTSPFSQ